MIVTLYKRSSNGSPLEWTIKMHDTFSTGIALFYGKVGGTTYSNYVEVTMQTAVKEFNSRVEAKRKEGYKYLEELYDNAPKFVDGGNLYHYLNTYLPKYNDSYNGATLPMLAKTLENNKPFEKYGFLLGQWKINGERCIVGAINNNDDMFKPINLTFHSRIGTEWKLPYLEEALLEALPKELIEMMIETGAKLDGELYIPGYKINEINHFIKNPSSTQHKQLQYWIYDIAVEAMPYVDRRLLLEERFDWGSDYYPKIYSLEDHLNNKNTIVFLPEKTIDNFNNAIHIRDSFINLGFEGLILRNPSEEYDFGARRVGHMYKFKKILDGKFEIIDIVPEGKKRSNLGKFVLRNDINDALFECTYNASHTEQEYILAHKKDHIGKYVKVEYRERSGVDEVPFHAKGISII